MRDTGKSSRRITAILVLALGAALATDTGGVAVAQVADPTPLTASEETAVTASGARRMATSVTLQRSGPLAGQLDAVTTTSNAVALTGFTGGVYVQILDANGAVIGVTDLHTYGVDGRLIGRARRTDTWQHRFPAEIAARTVTLRIIQQHTPRPRIDELIQEIQRQREQICATLGICY
jgi:hypothetical protein